MTKSQKIAKHFTRRFSSKSNLLAVNGKEYALPSKPVVGICVDGCAIEYIEKAIDAGVMPFWKDKSSHLVAGVFPTYTNPNNAAIITGSLPKENGICGNWFLDEEGNEVLMTAEHLWNDNILGKISEHIPVLATTSKNKLLSLITHGFRENSIGISIEKLHKCADTRAEVESRLDCALSDLVPYSPPDIYDPHCAAYTVEIGAAIIERGLSDPSKNFLPLVSYLSTTDYVQHKYPPGSDVANELMRRIDVACARMHEAGAIVGLTADHGMNDKTRFDGSPKVVYLQTILSDAGIHSRVVLPITDPYVVHHGALGGFATIYLADEDDFERACTLLRDIPGIYTVIGDEDAVEAFDLPIDRIGHICVFGQFDTCMGVSEEYHDLTHVEKGLRSHGGIDEVQIPMLLSQKPSNPYALMLNKGKARNFHLFNILLNGYDSDLEHLCPYKYVQSQWQYVGGREVRI